MEFFRAISRFPLSPVVMLILLASVADALAGDELLAKPAPVNEGTRFFLITLELGGARAAVVPKKLPDISSIALFQGAKRNSGLSFPSTIPARGHRDYAVEFIPRTGGTSSATLTFVTDRNLLANQNLTSAGDQLAQMVDLSWNASTSPDVVGYNVYRGTMSGGPYTRINSVLDPSTAYTDSSVANGSTYYYVATAVDSSGNESAYSNESQAVIP